MHATDTADCAVLLSGELTMLLDEGDVDFKPGDAIIQRGTNHALVNRGTEPALLACLIMDAVPLDRRRPTAG
jgi:mannose-6-phosphate isomerase-like protein (cupin superfamily)